MRIGAMTAGVLYCLAGVCVLGQTADRPPVRVLFGFEKDEIARIVTEVATKNKNQTPEQRAEYARKLIQEQGPDRVTARLLGVDGEGLRLTLRKGDATEGEWAFVCENAQERWRSYAPGAYNRIFNYRTRFGQRQDVINFCGRFYELPGGTNWTGYARLWLDVKSGTEAVFRLGIEDAEVMPPVERRFRIPAGKWVTAQMDLDMAREVRRMDLSKMVNYYVFLEEVAGKTTILIDNIRLATREAAPALPVVVDESPYAAEERNYAVMQFPEMKNRTGMNCEEIERSRSGLCGQWRLLEFPADEKAPPKEKAGGGVGKGPWRVDIIGADGKYSSKDKGVNGLGFVHSGILEPIAYDAYRIAVPVVVDCLAHVVCTTDGGATWRPAARPCAEWPVRADSPSATLVGYRQDGCGGGASVIGDETYLMSNVGCCYYGWPSDCLFFSKIELTREGWRVSPAAPVDRDLRHCTVAPAVLRLASGRLWAAHSQSSRFGKCGIAALYSDDGGKSWHSWRPGKHALLPGSLAALGTLSTYGGDRVSLFPYGDDVACVVSGPSSSRAYLWTCQGTTWSEMTAVPGLKERVFTALSPDGKAVLMNTIGRHGGVYRDVGGTCTAEQVNGYAGSMAEGGDYSYGFLSRCGQTVMLFGAAEFGKGGPGAMSLACKKILCWKRASDGTWSDPVEVVREDEFIKSFTCTRFATDAGVVLAWTCDGAGWIKAMIVKP